MSEPRSAELFHYTCGHAVAGITADGALEPNHHPLLGVALVWLTDLSEPFRLALGLTSYSLGCDRTEYRFDIASARVAEHWPRYCRRIALPRRVSEAVEDIPGVLPAHWWVSTVPVAVQHSAPIRMHARADA